MLKPSARPRFLVASAASLTLVGAAAGVLLLAQPASAAGACGTSYGYGGYGGRTDPNGFYAPDMRSFVAECVNSSGRDLAHSEKGPNGQTGTFSSPGTWDATASALGFSILSSPQVGSVAQLHSGENAITYGDDGKPNGTLTGGDVVAYVDAVYSGGQALVRTYDSSSHQVKSFRIVAHRYLVLAGGQGIRNGVVSTPKPSVKPSPKPSVTPSLKPSATPSPSATVTASPSPSPAVIVPVESPSVAASPSDAVTTPGDVTNKKSKTLASKYGKAIGLAGVVVAVLLGGVVVAAARRTDDTGD